MGPSFRRSLPSSSRCFRTPSEVSFLFFWYGEISRGIVVVFPFVANLFCQFVVRSQNPELWEHFEMPSTLTLSPRQSRKWLMKITAVMSGSAFFANSKSSLNDSAIFCSHQLSVLPSTTEMRFRCNTDILERECH